MRQTIGTDLILELPVGRGNRVSMRDEFKYVYVAYTQHSSQREVNSRWHELLQVSPWKVSEAIRRKRIHV